MGFDEPALFDDDETLLAQALGQKVDLAELRAVGWVRVPYPEDGRPWGSGVFPTPSGKVELVSEALGRIGQPALPTFVAPREGPHGDAGTARAATRCSCSRRSTTRASSTPATPTCPSTAPPRGRRSSSSTPPTPRPAASPTARRARVWNDRASVELPARISGRLRPGVVAIPLGWWASQHPDGKSANALTNDTLTEWGGGVAFSDTLVEVAAATDRPKNGPAVGSAAWPAS